RTRAAAAGEARTRPLDRVGKARTRPIQCCPTGGARASAGRAPGGVQTGSLRGSRGRSRLWGLYKCSTPTPSRSPCERIRDREAWTLEVFAVSASLQVRLTRLSVAAVRMASMTEVAIKRSAAVPAARRRSRRLAGVALVWVLVLGNTGAIVWLWAQGGNLHAKTTGEALTSVARITGLLGAYLALIEVILLARLPALERLAGFDRLTVWHRWNGHATIDLVVLHVFFSVWGYAEMDR